MAAYDRSDLIPGYLHDVVERAFTDVAGTKVFNLTLADPGSTPTGFDTLELSLVLWSPSFHEHSVDLRIDVQQAPPGVDQIHDLAHPDIAMRTPSGKARIAQLTAGVAALSAYNRRNAAAAYKRGVDRPQPFLDVRDGDSDDIDGGHDGGLDGAASDDRPRVFFDLETVGDPGVDGANFDLGDMVWSTDPNPGVNDEDDARYLRTPTAHILVDRWIAEHGSRQGRRLKDVAVLLLRDLHEDNPCVTGQKLYDGISAVELMLDDHVVMTVQCLVAGPDSHAFDAPQSQGKTGARTPTPSPADPNAEPAVTVHFDGGLVNISGVTIPESTAALLVGRRLGDLMETHPALDARIVRSVEIVEDQTARSILVTLVPDLVRVPQ